MPSTTKKRTALKSEHSFSLARGVSQLAPQFFNNAPNQGLSISQPEPEFKKRDKKAKDKSLNKSEGLSSYSDGEDREQLQSKHKTQTKSPHNTLPSKANIDNNIAIAFLSACKENQEEEAIEIFMAAIAQGLRLKTFMRVDVSSGKKPIHFMTQHFMIRLLKCVHEHYKQTSQFKDFIDAVDKEKKTALYYAAKSEDSVNKIEFINILRDKKAKDKSLNKSESQSSCSDGEDLGQLLSKHTTSAHYTFPSKANIAIAFREACKKGKEADAIKIFMATSDQNFGMTTFMYVDRQSGKKPIHFMADNLMSELLTLVCNKYKATSTFKDFIDAVSSNKKTALYYAAKSEDSANKIEFINILKDYGADLKSLNESESHSSSIDIQDLLLLLSTNNAQTKSTKPKIPKAKIREAVASAFLSACKEDKEADAIKIFTATFDQNFGMTTFMSVDSSSDKQPIHFMAEHLMSALLTLVCNRYQETSSFKDFIDAVDKEKKTALYYAAKSKQHPVNEIPEFIKILYAVGAHKQQKNNKYFTWDQYINGLNDDQQKEFKQLCQNTDEMRETLHEYCQNNDIDAVKKLLDTLQGQKTIITYGPQEENPFHIAAAQHNIYMLKVLSEYVEGANKVIKIGASNDKINFLSCNNNNKYSPIFYAIDAGKNSFTRGCKQTIDYLIECGNVLNNTNKQHPILNHQDTNYMTPFFHILTPSFLKHGDVKSGIIPLLTYLIEHYGNQINFTRIDKEGKKIPLTTKHGKPMLAFIEEATENNKELKQYVITSDEWKNFVNQAKKDLQDLDNTQGNKREKYLKQKEGVIKEVGNSIKQLVDEKENEITNQLTPLKLTNDIFANIVDFFAPKNLIKITKDIKDLKLYKETIIADINKFCKDLLQKDTPDSQSLLQKVAAAIKRAKEVQFEIKCQHIANILQYSGGAKAKENLQKFLDAINEPSLLEYLVNRDIKLVNICSILGGSGEQGAEAFTNLLNVIKEYRAIIENLPKGVAFKNISSILHDTGAQGGEALKNLLDVIKEYQAIIEDLPKGATFENISSILSGTGAQGGQALKKVLNVIEEYRAIIDDLPKGVAFENISSILNQTGAQGGEALKKVLNVIEEYKAIIDDLPKGVVFKNISSILNKTGAQGGEALKNLLDVINDHRDMIATLPKGVAFKNISSILYGTGAQGGEALKNLLDVINDHRDMIETFCADDLEFTHISGKLYGSRKQGVEKLQLVLTIMDKNKVKIKLLPTLPDKIDFIEKEFTSQWKKSPIQQTQNEQINTEETQDEADDSFDNGSINTEEAKNLQTYHNVDVDNSICPIFTDPPVNERYWNQECVFEQMGLNHDLTLQGLLEAKDLQS